MTRDPFLTLAHYRVVQARAVISSAVSVCALGIGISVMAYLIGDAWRMI